jgi:hypothetical protein
MRHANLPQTLVLLLLLLIVALGLGLAAAMAYVSQARARAAQTAAATAQEKAAATAVPILVSATPPPTGAPLPIVVITATGGPPTQPFVAATEPTLFLSPTLPPTLEPEPLATEPGIATEPPAAPVIGGPFGAPPIPGPSPTWSVFDFPTPFPASGPTKLSFHVTLNSGGVLDYVAAVRPPLIKGVEDIGFLEQVKAASPNTVTIGRYVVQQLNIGEGDPAQRAIEFVNEWLPRYQSAPYVDYWEGWNEVTYPNYEWYAVFEATRACEMQKHGLRAAIGAFSTGTPEPWQFEAFLPAIEAGIRCGAILTTHEYGAPTMYLWWSQGLPPSYGHPAVPAYPDRGPLIGRYRFLYNDVLLPRGLNIRLAITEAGIDGGAGAGQRPGYGGQGWLGFQDYWRNELGVADTAAFYAQQLAWYDSMMRQDSYVIGATIFNVSGGSSWESFEASSIIPQLIQYAQTLN